jgi:Tfp pilus assembly protein PilX
MKPVRDQVAAVRRERGIVLLVAMLAAVALALAGMGLVRAVATDATIGANVAARQRAALAASSAVEQAIATLFGAAGIDPTHDTPSRNYFAARQPAEDLRGVPATLQSLASYPAEFGVIDAGDGFLVRHVVERSCVAPGDASVVTCTLSPPSVEAASGEPPPDEPPRTPFYRVTIRVDGPAAAATFVQVMLSPAQPGYRLSWRTLDE